MTDIVCQYKAHTKVIYTLCVVLTLEKLILIYVTLKTNSNVNQNNVN